MDINLCIISPPFNQDFMAGSVIEVSGMALFNDTLEAGKLGEDIWSAPTVPTMESSLY